MNRLSSLLPAGIADGDAAPEFPVCDWQPEPGAVPSTTPAVALPLVTRRMKPGTSIRRIRNHRCAWPRRA